MATADPETKDGQSNEVQLERSTYEIIQNRMRTSAGELREKMDKLNVARRDVFGSIETKLLNTERITTANNCTPRDMTPIGDRFIFGYNVQIGLKSETKLEDVFAVHRFENGTFHEEDLSLLSDKNFLHDFQQVYKYYKTTRFTKFQIIGAHLYMVFQVGKSARDIKAFKWLIQDNDFVYVDGRSEHEVKYPPQHDFQWTRTHRDFHRMGEHPHISVEDRVFVETVGGDLTVKIEDNTLDGEGIYSEPVDDPDQTLDDAEIFYAIVDNNILLKIKPYKEEEYRYLVFNEKVQKVMRLDAIEYACVLLPEGHGLIFANGYYLQTGEHKTFETSIGDLLFEKKIQAANGEDFLYVFYSQASGDYVLLSYNMISQEVATPIICNGFSFFENGHLSFFKSADEPQKHHGMQIWQTPYLDENFEVSAQTDSYLYKIGNRDIVRGMAECVEIINLIEKDDSYANLYVDIVKKSTDVLDSYFWLTNSETHNLAEQLQQIKDSATAAVEEFEKVVRVRRNTKQQFDETTQKTKKIISSAGSRRYDKIDDYVASLADLRTIRGEIISLKELKYVDLQAVESLEEEVELNSDRVSHRCVEFLLREDSLSPYEQRVDDQRQTVEELQKVTDGKKLEEEISKGAAELEMLIDIVSNLKIDDATQRTRIIDNISAIYSKLNQARAALKKKQQSLLSVEGTAEFNSQLKLISQAVVNYLDVCDSPERCDEYLTKMMVQVEELEGKFAEFDEFIVQLSEKREEIYSAFDSRKLQLVEARNKRATALTSAAERILNGVKTRVNNLSTINEINSYFASDLMIDKIRDIMEQLTELEDNVRVDDIQSRLKTVKEDAVRQLKDRQELFVDGANIIQLGRHKFSVNVQNLDLTSVFKDGEMYFHLTGTNFMEPILDESFLSTRPVWDQDLVSENQSVYRAEYLSYQLLKSIEDAGKEEVSRWIKMEEDQVAQEIQKFMGPRYAEGYVKGVHDHDAAKILRGLLNLKTQIGLLRYPVDSRALASVYWNAPRLADQKAEKKSLAAKIRGMGAVSAVFENAEGRKKYIAELAELLGEYSLGFPQFEQSLARSSAEYLFEVVSHDETFPVSENAATFANSFMDFLKRHQSLNDFQSSVKDLATHQDRFTLIVDWLSAYADQHSTLEKEASQVEHEYILESAAAIAAKFTGKASSISLKPFKGDLKGNPRLNLTEMLGSHSQVDENNYLLDFNAFSLRLENYETQVVPKYNNYVQLKKELLETKKEDLRLEEFRPRVLTSFVRNQLINDVYLPLIGDNFAKQMGSVGDSKRTDLMGLLLLVSPPGYGKTTLMEYISNRLGITFMKINGPAIGHHVTSLDPTEAPNASAREEVEKLNLALEMGDNIMIYLDDIQHCNPEFLQKFISLCDGSRRIEGVYQGKTRTYDLRGRKVCVVMAGNPYTESGEKFQIPDMLANRADTYNLGDVIGDTKDAFELSYLENCLTSNPSLGILQSKSQKDIYAIIKMAEQDEPQGASLEGNYSIEQINELVNIMRKLFKVRDVLLKVNMMYIESAAQADEYRTEPPFKLQGSYRDMNKIAERVVPIMNDEELDTLIMSHFENQAQTLTTGAEANLLKFKELIGIMTDEDEERWDNIRRTFKRNLLLGSAAQGDDKFGQVIAQMTTFSEGLADIRSTLEAGVTSLGGGKSKKKLTQQELEEQNAKAAFAKIRDEQISNALQHLGEFNQNLNSIREALSQGSNSVSQSLGSVSNNLSKSLIPAEQAESAPAPRKDGPPYRIQVVNKIPKAFLDIIRTQFYILQTWIEPMMELAEATDIGGKEFKKAMRNSNAQYQELLEKIQGHELDAENEADE